MKISQNYTQQIVTPPDAVRFWIENPDCYWLSIERGLALEKDFDGRISIEISAQNFRGYHFVGSLCNTKTGEIIQITPLMRKTIPLDPKCRYILIISQTITDICKATLYETRTIEFSPD